MLTKSSAKNCVRTIEARAFTEKQSAISQFERRSFLKRLGLGGATLIPAAGWLASASTARADSGHGGLTRGDAAILPFFAAAENPQNHPLQQYTGLAFGDGAL